MTNYIILVLCIIILLSYLFDITSRFSKIPSIILLIVLGILIRLISESTGFIIPNLEPLLPIFGTLGLIMIVMDASLDITIEQNKKRMILRSVSTAFFLFTLFSAILSFSLVQMGFNIRDSLLTIPAGSRIPLISEEVITLVMFMTIIVLAYENIIQRKERQQTDTYDNKKPLKNQGTKEILNTPAMPGQENG